MRIDRGQQPVQPVLWISERIGDLHAETPETRLTDRYQQRCLALDSAFEIAKSGRHEVAAGKRTVAHY